jgi:hypothetical protein
MSELNYSLLIVSVLLLLLLALFLGKNIGLTLEAFGFRLNFFTKDSNNSFDKKLQQCHYCKQQIRTSRFNNHLEKCPARKKVN